MYVPSRCTFVEPLEMWNVSCWLSWLMIVMGHLQSTSLYNCHVQGNLYPACGYCLHRRLGWFSNPYLLYISVVILQFQYHNHFFCDILPLLALSSSDTTINEIVMFTFIGCVVGTSIITVLLSYSYIITTILRMNSSEGRCKAFSTCASHWTAVAIFHGTLLFMYFRPSSGYSMGTDKMASVFYTDVIPMLNPLIYSLRNKDVKGALKKATSTKLCSGWYSTFILKYLKILREAVQELWHRFL